MSQKAESDLADLKKEPINASFDITKVVNKEGKYTTIPDTKYDVRETFGLDVDWKIPGFKEEKTLGCKGLMIYVVLYGCRGRCKIHRINK